MIAVSNDFKNAMKSPIKELNAYIKIDETNSITSANDLISFKIGCESGLCKTSMRKIEASYYGEHNLLGKWVHIGFGVKLPNGTFEYLDYGSFLITEITTSKDTEITKVIGYDKMINAMKPYEVLQIEYPINLYQYTQKICEKCGFELKNATFVHADWLINEDLWKNINGITYRDILVQIAQVTASTCIVTNDDKVYFKSITSINEQLTYANMFKLKLEPKYGEINSVVLSRTPQEDNIYMRDEDSIQVNGLTEFKIQNNEIIDKDRDNAITPIYNALHGISYYPFECETEGLGWYEIADSFDIVGNSEDVLNTTLFNFSITIDGSIKEILKSNAETKTQTQYQYASTINRRVSNTEIEVNKQKETIKSTVEIVNEQGSQLAELIQTSDSIQLQLSETVLSVGTLQGTVKNMNFNFNTQNLAISSEGSDNKTLINNNGVQVLNKEKLVAIFNNNGGGIEDLIVTGSAQVGYIKAEKGTKSHWYNPNFPTEYRNKPITNLFYLESNIQSLDDLVGGGS